jgi:cell division inhibitor SulA
MSTATFSLASVLDRPDVWRGDVLGRSGLPGISSGFPALDAELPGGGWPVGALTEIFPEREGIGELRLLGPALASLAQLGTQLAWIAPPYLPYAPALAAAGIDPAKLLVVRTASAKDALWALEQALRSNACGAVLAWLPKAKSALKYADLRRLQIAAEGARAPAFLFRSGDAACESSPAALRISVGAAGGNLAIRLLKRRGAPLASPILLPAMPPAAVRKSGTGAPDHHVDRHSISASTARDLLARLAHA